MLLFVDAKLVFFSTPKTGSTAYHAILKRRADLAFSGKTKFKHMTARHFDRHIAPYLKKAHQLRPERVAVIRDPLAQLGSWYRYRQRPDKTGKSNNTKNVTFEEFVLAYMSDERPDYAKIGSQYKFVSSPKGAIRINHLFAHERPEVLKAFLEKRLKFDCSTDRLNVSPDGDLSLSQQTERKLKTYLAKDFELYDRILQNGGHLITKL